MTPDAGKPPTPARSPLLSPYRAAWAVIGLMAAVYLTAVAVRPDLVSQLLPVYRSGDPEGNQGPRAASKTLAEVQSLRQSVSQVQLDVAKIKADLTGSQERGNAIATRVLALEEKLVAAPLTAYSGAAKGAAPAAAAPSPPEKGPAERQTAAASKGGAATLDASGFDRDSLLAGLQLETGSVASSAATAAEPRVLNAPRPPDAARGVAPATARAEPAKGTAEKETAAAISFGPAVVKPAPEPIGVRISNGPSLDALRLSWTLLSDRHAAQLRSLEARYVSRGTDADGSPSFDLVAGPVKSQAEAKRICKVLAAQNVPCQIGAFGGSSL